MISVDSSEVGNVAHGAGHSYWTLCNAWLIRRYWRRQARRLHAAELRETAGARVSHLPDLRSLELSGMAADVVALHHEVYMRDPFLLGGDSEATLRARLVHELYEPARIALLTAPDGALGGFCWGQLGDAMLALRAFQRVPALVHLRADDWLRVQSALTGRIGASRALVLHAIGLAPRWRKGFAPIKHLLRPMLDFATSRGVTGAVWWTQRRNPIYALSLAFGSVPIASVGNTIFLFHPDIEPVTQILNELPASAVTEHLARFDQRQPATAVSGKPQRNATVAAGAPRVKPGFTAQRRRNADRGKMRKQ